MLSTSQSSISSVVDHFLCCFTDTVTEKFRMVQEKKKAQRPIGKRSFFTVYLLLTFLVEQQTSTHAFYPSVHTVALMHLLAKQMFFSWVFQP